MDGRLVDSGTVARLENRGGTVWGVVTFPSPDRLSLMSNAGTENIDFVDAIENIRVVLASETRHSALDRARTLLRWELPLQPALAVSLTRIGGDTTS